MSESTPEKTDFTCPFCGYDLRAQVEHRAERCSECGLLLPRIPAEPETTYVERYQHCLEGIRARLKYGRGGARTESGTGCACPVCGYDLGAQIGMVDQCPECGLVLPRISAEPAETYAARYQHCLDAKRARLNKGWKHKGAWPERSRIRDWLGRFKQR